MRFTPPRQPSPDSRCSSVKKGYDTEAEALDAKAYGERKRGARLDVYHCMECFRWHLTSKIKDA